MSIDAISSSREEIPMEPESRESTGLKRRTQEVWLQTPLPNITEIKKPTVHTFSWVVYDRIADNKIGEILKAAQFYQETVQYSYEGSSYELSVIFNPDKLSLRKAAYGPTINKILIIDTPEFLPALLKNHLQEVCIQNHIDLADAEFNMGYYGSWSSLQSLTPIKSPPVTPQKINTPIDNKKNEEPRSTEQSITSIENSPAPPKMINTPIDNKKNEEPRSTEQSITPIENSPAPPQKINTPIDNEKNEETVVPRNAEPKKETESLSRWLFGSFFG